MEAHGDRNERDCMDIEFETRRFVRHHVAQEAFGALVEDVWAQSPGISIGKYAATKVVMVAAGI